MKIISDMHELNRIYEEHRAEVQTEQSYEDMLLEKYFLIEYSLEHNNSLAMQCFETCTLDFFLYFSEEFQDFFEQILKTHKKAELFHKLKERVSSFQDEKATRFLLDIQKNVADMLA